MQPYVGKILVISGLILVAIGVLIWFGGRIPFLGRLPGDITIKKNMYTLYIPIVTMIVVSIILTVLLNLFRK